MTTQDELKQQAAVAAVERVESGMVVGLGTGSTTQFALEHLAELIKIGKLKRIVGIPSSLRTEKTARELGIPFTDFGAHPVIDLTIDGADEVDRPNLIRAAARPRWRKSAQASQ
jgi:ribose 5-phosphate isomerase A